MISFPRKKIRARTAILLRTKDRPIFLRRALESILSQTDQDWAIALVNDGGDRSELESALLPFSNQLRNKLTVVHFEKSRGRGKGEHLNAGLSAVDSELVAIHDDDDTWDPNFLAKSRSAMGDQPAVVTQSYLVLEQLKDDLFHEVSREIYEPWQKHGVSLFRLAESLTFPPIALQIGRAHV